MASGDIGYSDRSGIDCAEFELGDKEITPTPEAYETLAQRAGKEKDESWKIC